MECWPGSKVLILKYRDLMSMSTSIYLCTHYPPDKKIKNTRVLITKKNQLLKYTTLLPTSKLDPLMLVREQARFVHSAKRD